MKEEESSKKLGNLTLRSSLFKNIYLNNIESDREDVDFTEGGVKAGHPVLPTVK